MKQCYLNLLASRYAWFWEYVFLKPGHSPAESVDIPIIIGTPIKAKADYNKAAQDLATANK